MTTAIFHCLTPSHSVSPSLWEECLIYLCWSFPSTVSIKYFHSIPFNGAQFSSAFCHTFKKFLYFHLYMHVPIKAYWTFATWLFRVIQFFKGVIWTKGNGNGLKIDTEHFDCDIRRNCKILEWLTLFSSGSSQDWTFQNQSNSEEVSEVTDEYLMRCLF